MGGPVSSLGEEVGKDSTADGGHGDEQERWEVKAWDSGLQTPENSSFAYFIHFILQIWCFILQIITGIEPL